MRMVNSTPKESIRMNENFSVTVRAATHYLCDALHFALQPNFHKAYGYRITNHDNRHIFSLHTDRRTDLTLFPAPLPASVCTEIVASWLETVYYTIRVESSEKYQRGFCLNTVSAPNGLYVEISPHMVLCNQQGGD
jgi:hypothetical protein